MTFNPETLEKLKKGVDTIANAVKSTLGPRGRNVIIQNMYGSPQITKDGVTVAKQINLKDSIENLAAEVMKQAATRTVAQCGDGTSTAIVLAQAIFNEGYKYIQMGMISPIELRRGLEKELERVTSFINSKSEKISSPNQLEQIATISANNDEELGKLIAEAFIAAGEEGIVLAEDSKSTHTHVEVTQGAKFDRGYVAPAFISNFQKLTCELENPLILFYDKKLRAAQDIVPIVTMAAEARKPLLIIADEIESQALSILVINKLRAGLQLCAVRTPGFGERRGKMLEDLAILTGGTVISDKTGKTLSQVKLSDLGNAEKVIVGKADTTIISTANTEAVKKRIENIKSEIDMSESGWDSQKSKERIAMLAGKVAILRIGAMTEIELKEKKDRVDDAIQATQAALKSGIVPGGGLVYFNASKELGTKLYVSSIAKSVMNKALLEPIKVICENAAESPEVVMNNIGGEIGFNANNYSYEDMKLVGIIDPTLVLTSALENAVSVANMLLSTSTAITVAESLPQMSPEMPDMGGMYDM